MSKSPYRYEVQDPEARAQAAFPTAARAVAFLIEHGAEGWRVVDPDTHIVLWTEGMNGTARASDMTATAEIEHRWYMSRAARRMALSRARRSEVSRARS